MWVRKTKRRDCPGRTHRCRYGSPTMSAEEVMPLEVLKAGNCINQNVIIFTDSSKKYEVTTTWKDADGKDYSSKETKVWD